MTGLQRFLAPPDQDLSRANSAPIYPNDPAAMFPETYAPPQSDYLVRSGMRIFDGIRRLMDEAAGSSPVETSDEMIKRSADAAMLTMGGGAFGIPERGVEAVLGSGPTGRLPATRNPLTGRLQVAPQQKLTDLFVAGGPPVESTARVPLRGQSGRYSTIADYYRGRVPTEEERTGLISNPMYDPANPPAPFVSRLESPNRADPESLARNLSRIPNAFGSATTPPVRLIPVDHDPFAEPRLIPVDHDPF